MKQLDREEAIDFYRTFYTPANAVLIVAGDVTAEEVKALAEKHYGVLKNTLHAEAAPAHAGARADCRAPRHLEG